MKKNIFSALAAAFLLVSCSSNDIMNDVSEGINEEVGFSTFVGQQTRAGVCDIDTLKSDGFYVLGYSTIGDNWDDYAAGTGAGAGSGTPTTPTVNFMANDRITHNGTGWTYANKKYWPKEYDGVNLGKVSFFAYSPNVNVTAPGNGAQSLPIIDFTCPAEVLNQVDFVADSVVNRTSASHGGVTKFNFGHKLSKIGFSMKTLGDYPGITVELKKFEVVYNEHTIASGKFNIATDAWDVNGATAMGANQSTVIFEGNTIISSTAWVNDKEKFLMLIPQGATSFTANITYKMKGMGTTEIEETFPIEVVTKGWAMGRQYVYNFNVELDEIIFDGEAENDWADDTNFTGGDIEK